LELPAGLTVLGRGSDGLSLFTLTLVYPKERRGDYLLGSPVCWKTILANTKKKGELPEGIPSQKNAE